MTDKMINIQVCISKNGLEDIETSLEVHLNYWKKDLRSEVYLYLLNNKPDYLGGSYTIVAFEV